MQRALILLGILAAAGLLAWQFTGEQARRVEREERPAIEPLPKDEEVSNTVETAELRGIVKDARGQPIAGVRVEVPQGSDEPPIRAETAADGWFRLDLPEQPWVILHLRHPEFLARETWGRLEHDNEFELERGAPLTVLVLDSEGSPVTGAEVSTTHTSTEGARGIWMWSDSVELGSGKTGADGRFVVGAAPLSPFDLFVKHEAYAAHSEEIELRALQPTEHVVRLGEGGVVEGTVFAPDGEAVEGAEVRAGRRSGVTDADGQFRIERV
ncbi:MAG: carboxypeptidase-like regulatory domain-containing protein, partial [Planctomycetota bacterium]